MPKTFSRDECDAIYRNLMEQLSNPKVVDPRFYIRELMDTKGCDYYHNMMDLRDSINDKIGKNNIERITGKVPYSTSDVATYKREKKEDKEKSRYTLMHYHYWHRRTILDCLKWSHWFYYKVPWFSSLGAYKWVKEKDRL